MVIVGKRRQIGPEAILEQSRQIISQGGIARLTFQELASRLGVTKQAIIYWFGTKQDLARALVVPVLRAEADTTIAALDGAATASDAIGRFVRALVAHHLADLGSFRLIYLAGQLEAEPTRIMTREALDDIHTETGRMYGALERAVAADPGRRSKTSPRRVAAAVHMAAIGLVTMLALAEAADDPLAHNTEDLVDTMVALLA